MCVHIAENRSPQNIEPNFQQCQKRLYVCKKKRNPQDLDLGKCNDLYKDPRSDGTMERKCDDDDDLIRDGRHGN